LDGVDILLTLGVRVGFFGYWLFDNLLILAKLKLFSKPASSFLKPAMFSWWVALMLNLIFNIKKLRAVKAELKRIKRNIKNNSNNSSAFASELAGELINFFNQKKIQKKLKQQLEELSNVVEI
jgi:hypothetical protein